MPHQQSLFSFYDKGNLSEDNQESSFQNTQNIETKKGSYVQLQKQQGQTPWQLSRSREQYGANLSMNYTCQAEPTDVTQRRNSDIRRCKGSEQAVQWLEQSPLEKTQPATHSRSHNSYAKSEELVSELCAPHTPSLRPLVPGIRRVTDSEQVKFSEKTFVSDSVKRRKLLDAVEIDDGFEQGSWAEARSKFDWLHPVNIRDGDGRKASDPFFDRRTVKVPEKIFNQFSASQKQYWSIKRQYLDTVLFFKVGKFYELYELDAEIGHKELDWKMTLSGVGKCRQVGVSESGIDEAVQKLVARGYKVGRMEQIETAAQAKALRGPKATIQRELKQVLTPSTLTDGNLRPEAIHLMALKEELFQDVDARECCHYGFAFVDAAVGRFYVGCMRDNTSRSALGSLLTQLAPQELLYELGGLSKETQRTLQKYSPPGLLPVMLTPLRPVSEFMESAAAVNFLLSCGYFKHAFKVTPDCLEKSEESWPEALSVLPHKHLAASALGALSSHIQRLKSDDELLPNAELYTYNMYSGFLRLDGQTITNLELLNNCENGSKSGSLLGYLDSCCTVFGKRLLRRWICHPLQDCQEINGRLDAIDELILHPELTSVLIAQLRKLPDLERIVARIRGLAGSPAVDFMPAILVQRRLKLLQSAIKGLQDACELMRCLKTGIGDEGPPKARILKEAAAFLKEEKVGPVLAEIGSTIHQISSSRLGTSQQKEESDDSESVKLLLWLFSVFNEHQVYWSAVVKILARLDVLIALVVTVNNSDGPFCRPKFAPDSINLYQTLSPKGGAHLDIKGLWHPFAAHGLGDGIVPNDVKLGMAGGIRKPCAMLVTGPNMGGKSTLLRATCLAVIMAQLGCYVPGESCTLSLVDTIFTRIGASDRIMTGESTFFVECSEAASVLQHATSKSLVILDELGRGTSTFDGYAIAYAVFRHLVETLDCRLLFATHYHPLTKEFSGSRDVSLQHMACSFESPSLLQQQNSALKISNSSAQSPCLINKQLVFLYKLTPGACPNSYGLQVARLAGIPESVVLLAEKVGEVMHSQLKDVFQAAYDAGTDQSLNRHHQCLKSLIAVSKLTTQSVSPRLPSTWSEDVYDTLLCLWHEVRELTA